MPVYNQKPEFLLESVASVIKQTYKYLELIVVDDGSSDEATLKCLETLEQLDSRIKLTHMEKN